MMPPNSEAHDYLPYVDPQPSSEELATASALLATEVSAVEQKPLHDSVPLSFEPQFPPLTTAAHDSIATTGSARPEGSGVDLSRYEEPTAPDAADTTRASWQATLRQAYISHSYLSQRQLNLSLLERFGKNAWLISNSQVEQELKSLEQELARTKSDMQQLEEERTRNQSRVKGELDGLEETWRVGVGRAIETEVAAEGLRREILDARRKRH